MSDEKNCSRCNRPVTNWYAENPSLGVRYHSGPPYHCDVDTLWEALAREAALREEVKRLEGELERVNNKIVECPECKTLLNVSALDDERPLLIEAQEALAGKVKP